MNKRPTSFLLLFLLIAALALLPLYGPMFGGAALYFRDVLHNYYPQISFLKASVLRGDLPFWNPYLFNGTPQMAGLEPPLFYPLAWMFFLLPYQLALALNLCLHHLLAALGIYLLGGQYRWSWAARVLAALTFSFGGVMISMNNFHPLQNAVAWMPLLIWAAHRVLHEQNLRPLLWFSLAYALQILSGHLEIVYFTSLLILAYTFLFLKSQGRRVLWLGLAVLLGLLLSGLQLLPSLLYSPLSVRQGGLESFNASLWSYHPLLSSLFILPDHNGNVFSGLGLYMILGEARFGQALFFLSAYMGLLAWLGLGLALWRLPTQPQRKLVVFWLGVLVIACLLAFGHYLPVYGLASHLPGMTYFRYPSKFLIVVALAFAVLAGWGLDALEEEPERLRQLLKMTLALGAGFVLSAAGLWLTRQGLLAFLSERVQVLHQMMPARALNWSQDVLNQILIQIGRQLLFCALLLAAYWLAGRMRWKSWALVSVLIGISILDLLMSGINAVWLTSGDVMKVQSPVASFLESRQLHRNNQERYLIANKVESIPAEFRSDIASMMYFRPNLYQAEALEDNYGMNYGFRDAYGFFPAHTHLSNLFYLLYEQGLTNGQTKLRNALESQSAARYLLLPNPKPDALTLYEGSDAYRKLMYFPELNSYVFENLNYLPRARFYYQSAVVKDEKMVTTAFANPEAFGFKLKEQVLLLDDQALKRARELVPSQEAKVKRWTPPAITKESNNRVELSFETNTSGYLLLADQYIQGWQAFDNGKEVPILRANFWHRAVRVGPGKHQIMFEYHPPGFTSGLLISALAGLCWLGIFFWCLRRRPIPTDSLSEQPA